MPLVLLVMSRTEVQRTRQNSPNMVYPLLYFSEKSFQGLGRLGV